MLYNRVNCSALTRMGYTLTILSLLWLVTGCSIFSPTANIKNNVDLSDTEITIYSSFEDPFFYKFYGNYLIQKFPNLKLRLIQSTSETAEETVREIREYNPDLVITSKFNFRELQKQNVLTDLSTLAESSNMNLEDLYPEMINALKDDSGQLSGLSPSVNPSVIFYNKNLFDANKISYPVNQMSWDETLSLTQRFIGSGTPGLTGRTPATLLSAISVSKGWNIVDNQTKELFFNSQEWISSIQNILDSSSEGNIVDDNGELFLQGKAAMHYGTLSMIPLLLESNTFYWEVVTGPVDPLNRDVSQDIYFYDIFSIPAGASQKDEAWGIVQALLSEDAVNYVQRNSNPGSVSTLDKLMNSQYSNVDLSAIWTQKIDTKPYLGGQLTRSFIDKFDGIVEAVLTQAIKNKNRTSTECFKEIEEQARLLYQEESPNTK